MSPDGSTVFVTGASEGKTSGLDYATEAIDASTGAQLWVRRYNGPGNGDDSPVGLVVSPDGSKVFVTGTSAGSSSGEDYATEALDASSGAVDWVRRYNGPGNGDDRAAGLAISADGSRVYVTGQSDGGAGAGVDYATVSYNASTGAVAWVRRVVGPGSDSDAATGIAVTPDGNEVVVTGTSRVSSSQAAYLTVAYDPVSGAHLWSARYGPANRNDRAAAIASSPDSSKVFVTGTATDSSGTDQYLTAAYNASTGAREWQTAGAAGGDALALAVSPDGTKVYVSGGFPALGGQGPTIAYSTSTGTRLWSGGFGSADCMCVALAASPDGNTVWVVTVLKDLGVLEWATAALSAATGKTVFFTTWGSGTTSVPSALAISSDSKTIFITGQAQPHDSNSDYATLSTPVSGVT